MTFKADETKSVISQQINKVIVCDQSKLVIAGTEDNQLRFFDLNSNKQIKAIIGHTDAINSLTLYSGGGTSKSY